MNLASGRTHFAYYRSIKPWDHTAGVLLHREAGGYNGRLDGSSYVPDSPDRLGLLMTPDEESWTALSRIFPDFAAPPPP
jgi:fructose-1,6-bisphosphatase/inositol monophosphatase family enzyme